MLNNVQQIRLTKQVFIVYIVDKFMNEVKPVHNYILLKRIIIKIMNEIQKIRLTKQVSYFNAFKKYKSEVKEVKSVQSLNRFRESFSAELLMIYLKSFRL